MDRIWTMRDERDRRLISLATRHIKLEKKAHQANCTPAERMDCLKQIDTIKEERDWLLEDIG